MQRSYLPWALLYGYLLADDLFGIHEAAGSVVVRALNVDPTQQLYGGLRAQDLGELAAVASIALVVLAVMALYYLRAGAGQATGELRRTYRNLLLLTALLAAFGVVVDTIAVAATHYIARQLLHIAEDGGELLVISAILWYVYLIAQAPRRGADVERACLSNSEQRHRQVSRS